MSKYTMREVLNNMSPLNAALLAIRAQIVSMPSANSALKGSKGKADSVPKLLYTEEEVPQTRMVCK